MKRILTAILCLALVLCMTTASALVLRPGDKGNNVSALQQALCNNGYYVAIDGKYGPATTAAVKAFQAASGYLTVDGKAGPLTLTALGFTGPVTPVTPSTGSVLKVGSTGAEVLKLQKALIALGYPVGTADGKYGSKTYHAVVLFQTLNSGLKVDGKAGSATQAALYGANPVPYSSNPNPGNVVVAKVVLSTLAPFVGETLSATVTPSNANVTYTWYRDDDGVKLGTGAYYTVQMNDLHKRIYCVATGVGTTNGTVASPRTAAVVLTDKDAAKEYLTGTVTLPNTVQPGARLNAANPGVVYLNPNRDVYYAWYVGGVMVSSAEYLDINNTMVGKTIYLMLTAKNEKIENALRSNLCTVVAQTADGATGGTGDGSDRVQVLKAKVTIPAEAEPGSVLTPSIDYTTANFTAAQADTILTYEWYVGNTRVATGKTFGVTSEYVGQNIHLVLVPRTNSGYIEDLGSNYCTVKGEVKGDKEYLTGKPAVMVDGVVGSRAVEGCVLSVKMTGMNSTNVNYVWVCDGTVVGKAATLKVTSNMVGCDVYVTVTGIDKFGSVSSDKVVVHAKEY